VITEDDIIWLAVAKDISRKSRCVRSQVACVVVGANGRIVATGYNGAPAGFHPARRPIIHNMGDHDQYTEKPKCDSFCPRAMPGGEGDASVDYGNCVACHAEANAIAYSARHDLEGATIYVTRMPCWDCCKLIANSGIIRVVAPQTVDEDKGRAIWTPEAIDQYREFLNACDLDVVMV